MPEVKTLYMDGPRLRRVLRDGPALRVLAPACADRLYPFARIQRVIVSGYVSWDTDALLACAEHGVPVHFVGRDGTLRARVSNSGGPGLHLTDLADSLKGLCLRHRGLQAYQGWMDGVANYARQRIAYELGWGSTDPQRLRRLLTEQGRRYARTSEIRRLDRQLYGLVTVQLDGLLRELGVDPEAAWLMDLGLSPVRDFTNILIWDLELPKLGMLKRAWTRARRHGRARASLQWADAVRLFEIQLEALSRSFASTARGFHRFALDPEDHRAR